MEFYAYVPDRKWRFIEVVKILVVCVSVAWIFYDRICFFVLLFPLGIYMWKKDKKSYKRKMQELLRDEFKEFIILISGSLNAGYSLELSIRRAWEDMESSHEFEIMPKELAVIINGLNLNRDVEILLLEMGQRCQERNIIEFAGLVATAKTYGGNINTLIDKTKKKLNDKIMVEKEIETLVSAKQLEGTIMLIMPFAMMIYMRLTNGSYISKMYDTGFGIAVLTVALLMVVISGFTINKITNIEV